MGSQTEHLSENHDRRIGDLERRLEAVEERVARALERMDERINALRVNNPSKAPSDEP